MMRQNKRERHFTQEAKLVVVHHKLYAVNLQGLCILRRNKKRNGIEIQTV